MTFKIYNPIQKVIIGTLMIIMLVTPLVSSAQEPGDSRFCNNLDRIERTVMQRLAQRVDAAHDRYGVQVDRYTTQKQERIANLHDRREELKETWRQRIASLKAGATDRQLEAIDVFVATVESLVDDKKITIDEAIDVFETAVQELRDERTEVFNDMLERYKNAVTGAFDEAKVSCDAGNDPSEIRAELRSSITELREAFKAEREGYEYRARYIELRDERRQTVERAKEVFKNSFQEAKEILKEAFNS